MYKEGKSRKKRPFLYAMALIAAACAFTAARRADSDNDGDNRHCVWYGVLAAVVMHVSTGLMVIVAFRFLDVDVRSRPIRQDTTRATRLG